MKGEQQDKGRRTRKRDKRGKRQERTRRKLLPVQLSGRLWRTVTGRQWTGRKA